MVKNANKLKLPCGDIAFFPREIQLKVNEGQRIIFFVMSYIHRKGFLVGMEKEIGPLFLMERDAATTEQALELLVHYRHIEWEESQVKNRLGSFHYKTAPSPSAYQELVDFLMKQ